MRLKINHLNMPFALGIGVRRQKKDITLDVSYLWLHLVRSEDAFSFFKKI